MESSNMIDLLQQHEEPFFFLHDPLLNGNELIPSINSVQQHIVDPASFITSSHYMVQDLGFQWSGHGQRSSQQTQLAKIKEELSLEEQTQLHDYDSYLHAPLIHGKLGFDPLSLGMLLPSLNIPNAYFPSMDASTAMDMEALEMLESARFGRIGPCESFDVNSSTVFENINYGVVHPLHGRAQGGFMNLQEWKARFKIPTSVSGLTEGKRANCSSLDHLKTSKKPRFDSRSSLPPFKVRKEKLGDRIAALQQLVAPFGKTDTASVLMEAIGYIKFLQDQVETLSVPYMRTSKNKKLSTTEEVSIATQRENPKPDLRSRGLCLVPLSCTSYVTNDNAVWSPPNFR